MIPIARTLSITGAAAKLHELVDDTRDDNVVLVRNGRAAAVIVSPEHYEGLLEEVEDLKDRLSAYISGARDLNVPLSAVRSEVAAD